MLQLSYFFLPVCDTAIVEYRVSRLFVIEVCYECRAKICTILRVFTVFQFDKDRIISFRCAYRRVSTGWIDSENQEFDVAMRIGRWTAIYVRPLIAQ